jgi:Lon protease-like protein
MVDPPSVDLPIFPLGTILYPGAIMPLHIFEERYRKLMREHGDDEPIFGVVLTKTGREVGDEPDTYAIGTAASLVGARRYVDGRYDVVVRGGRRLRILSGDWSRQYLVASIEWLDEPVGDPHEADRLHGEVTDAFARFLDAITRSVGVDSSEVDLPSDPIELGYAIAARLPLDRWERQQLLEASSGVQRLNDLLAILRRERTLLLETGAAGAAIEHPGLRFSPN